MAPTEDVNVLVKELSKLKKDEIIEIMVFKKLPSNCASVVIKSFVSNPKTNLTQTSEQNQTQSDDKNRDTESDRYELEMLRKLCKHLEKRAQEQEDLIFLLKQTTGMKICSENQKKTTNNNIATHAQQEPSTSTKPNKNNFTEKYSEISLKQTSVTQKTETGIEYQQPNKNNNNNETGNSNKKGDSIVGRSSHIGINNNNFSYRRKPLIGNKTNTPTGIEVLPKYGYLHVYRCGPKVTCEELQRELNNSAPDIQFKCEKWNKTEYSSSFKVSFPIEKVKDVYNPDIWPAGLAVRRFRFPNKNFQQRHPNQEMN